MRTNIVLDETLIKRAFELSDQKTMRALINEALLEFIKKQEIRQLTSFRGSNAWEGELDEMRQTQQDGTY